MTQCTGTPTHTPRYAISATVFSVKPKRECRKECHNKSWNMKHISSPPNIVLFYQGRRCRFQSYANGHSLDVANVPRSIEYRAHLPAKYFSFSRGCTSVDRRWTVNEHRTQSQKKIWIQKCHKSTLATIYEHLHPSKRGRRRHSLIRIFSKMHTGNSSRRHTRQIYVRFIICAANAIGNTSHSKKKSEGNLAYRLRSLQFLHIDRRQNAVVVVRTSQSGKINRINLHASNAMSNAQSTFFRLSFLAVNARPDNTTRYWQPAVHKTKLY